MNGRAAKYDDRRCPNLGNHAWDAPHLATVRVGGRMYCARCAAWLKAKPPAPEPPETVREAARVIVAELGS